MHYDDTLTHPSHRLLTIVEVGVTISFWDIVLFLNHRVRLRGALTQLVQYVIAAFDLNFLHHSTLVEQVLPDVSTILDIIGLRYFDALAETVVIDIELRVPTRQLTLSLNISKKTWHA